MSMSAANVMEPNVVVESVGPGAASTGGRWLCTWRIQNLAQEPIQLLAAGLPHSRFRSEEQELSPAPKLLPGESARLALAVSCCEPTGTVVENAFLILRVLWREQLWRILARLRVVFDQHGAPESSTEVITTQLVGFSSSHVRERSRPD
jgi:hypothetical protein